MVDDQQARERIDTSRQVGIDAWYQGAELPKTTNAIAAEQNVAATKVQSLVRGRAARSSAGGVLIEKTAAGEEEPVLDEAAFKEMMGAGKASEEELSAQFKLLDTDGSGGLNKAELTKALADVRTGAEGGSDTAEPPSPKTVASPLDDMMAMLNMASMSSRKATEAAEKARKEADVADQKLVRARRRSRELEELIFDGLTLNDVGKLKQKFDEFDTDGSGAIDMEELRALLLKCGKSASNSQLKKLIAKFDENDDGVLQFEECAIRAEPWPLRARGTLTRGFFAHPPLLCCCVRFRNMIGKWDEILAQFEDEKARLEAALAAAEMKTPEAKSPDATTPTMGLSRMSSTSKLDSPFPFKPVRSRRSSKESMSSAGSDKATRTPRQSREDMMMSNEDAVATGSPAGSGAAAAAALRSVGV